MFRARWRQLPYGDQGLFMRRSCFLKVGGFCDWPLMEDYELVERYLFLPEAEPHSLSLPPLAKAVGNVHLLSRADHPTRVWIT